MFFPIGDTPNPKSYLPWVNWLLIAANVGVYVLFTLPLSMQPADPGDPLLREYLQMLAQHMGGQMDLRRVLESVSAYDLFVFQHGYRPGDPQMLSLLTSMFLHGGLGHLGGNMLFLWIFGDNVEHHLGRALYALVYLATGVSATLTFAVFAGDSMVPLVGASGAISGVLGLYFLLFRRNKVKIFVFLFPFIVDVWHIPVRWALGFYVIVDNLLPFIARAESSVAYGAHLGGFFAGLGAAWLGEKMAWRAPWSDSRAKKRSDLSSAPAMCDMSAKACVERAEQLKKRGMYSSAYQLLGRYAATHPRSSDLAPIFLELGLLSLERGQPTSAYQHLLSVFDFNPDPETERRAREALLEIDALNRRRGRVN